MKEKNLNWLDGSDIDWWGDSYEDDFEEVEGDA